MLLRISRFLFDKYLCFCTLPASGSSQLGHCFKDVTLKTGKIKWNGTKMIIIFVCIEKKVHGKR